MTRPRRRGPHVPALLTALITALAFGLGGCSQPADQDYTSVTTGMLVVDRPAGWQDVIPVQAPWAVGFRPTPTAVEQIQLSGDFGHFVTAGEAVGSLIGQAQVGLKEFHVVETRDLTVQGATTAQVVRYTITDNQDSQLSGEWIVANQWPAQQSAAVSILTPQYQPDLERRVVDSMRFSPKS
ncbi:hypothetical protein [uncultured Friedmanniella sp.]|uniref:hypothetical protein n=1 Tax=uncultured Friedmanniella sp. TaxID=335381 RepID=UPI0035CB9A99